MSLLSIDFITKNFAISYFFVDVGYCVWWIYNQIENLTQFIWYKHQINLAMSNRNNNG